MSSVCRSNVCRWIEGKNFDHLATSFGLLTRLTDGSRTFGDMFTAITKSKGHSGLFVGMQFVLEVNALLSRPTMIRDRPGPCQ